MDAAGKDDVFVAAIDFGVQRRSGDQDYHEVARLTIDRWLIQLQASDLMTWYANTRVAICLVRQSPLEVVELIQRLNSLAIRSLSFRAGIAMWNGFESSEALFARAEFELLQAIDHGVDGPATGPWLKSRLRSIDDQSN